MTRVYRVDTPHDLICASIVAGRQPQGRDILAFSTDKALGGQEYTDCIRALARWHDWMAIVDISGIPLNAMLPWQQTANARLRTLRNTRLSAQRLREFLAPALDANSEDPGLARILAGRVDEVYLTCLHHDDMRLLTRIFPSARLMYYPHGFDAFGSTEFVYYEPFCASLRSPHERIRNATIDALKRVLWGLDAVPVRHVTITTAYSFNREAPWAAQQSSLKESLNRETMERLFSQLPTSVQDYYHSLTTQHGARAGLLLLSSLDTDPTFPHALELEAYVDLVRYVVKAEHSSALIIKPHPRNGAAWVQTVASRLQEHLPALSVRVIDRYQHYPVEVVAAPLSLAYVAGMGSSSLPILHRVFGLRAYCLETTLQRLFAHNPTQLQAWRVWLSEVRGDLTLV